MRICAVLVNYFGADDTIACAHQLSRQPVERVCVVDNSVDAHQISRLTSAFADQKKILLFKTEENNGFGAGINYALQRVSLSDFDAVLIVNNDTRIPEGFVEKLSNGAREAGLQVAGPRIHHHPETEKLWSRGNYYNAWCGLVTHRSLPLPGNVFYITGCCMLVQCRVFETIGMFDKYFFMYGEDVDFCFRAARAGLKTGTIDTALMFHTASASSLNNSLFYEQQIASSHLRLSQRLFTHRAAQFLSVCVKTAFLCMRALLRTLRYKNMNALAGLFRGLFGTAPPAPQGQKNP